MIHGSGATRARDVRPWRTIVALSCVAACGSAPGGGSTGGDGGEVATSSGGESTSPTGGGSTGDGAASTSSGGDGTSTTGGAASTTGGGTSTTGDSTDSGGPVGEWVWRDVPGAICANGTPTGVGVNQGAGDRVVIYMSGGSACLDEECSIGTPSMRKDGGFGADELAACVAGDCDGGVTFPAGSIFNRGSAVNPFADATYVFISNCAGDYYVGDGEHAFAGWTAQFHGWRNQSLFAAALATSHADASRVILTGGSAGSVGAMLNYWQWVEAFAGTRVDLVSDSFAFVFVDGPEWRYELHNPQVPPGCATCVADYRTIYAFNASLAPGSRIAVLDSEDNWTLDLVSGFQYTQGVEALQPILDGIANVRYYVASGNVHILMQHPLDSGEIDVERDGEDPRFLSDFLARMQGDEPAWDSMSCLGP
jgi:hypothetical protein